MRNRVAALALLVASSTLAKPNIVFILADDMGWTGTSVEMIKGNPETKSDFYQTPNLEKLAAAGMVFSQAYAPAALCTPSRAAILTGKTPAELHMTTPGGGRTQAYQKLAAPRHVKEFPASETTIAERMKKAGYATALFGKWHIGTANPAIHGFDESDGPTENVSHGTAANPKDVFGVTDRAIAFMEKQAKAGTPFYLQLSHYAVHTPVESLEQTQEKFRKTKAGQRHSDIEFAAMTYDLDTAIGTLLKKIAELKLTETTYVVFMSDNGAPANPRRPQNTPLNGGKGTLYEGGIRVPLIVRGPGIKADTFCNESVTGCDLLPTFCSWAGIAIPGDIEGKSLASLLSGQTQKIGRTKPLLFHYPHYGMGPAQKPQTAIIEGNMKLLRDLETGTLMLFDLSTDLSEKNDLSTKYPEKTETLEKRMDQRLQETDAQMPTENPDYKPSATQTQRRRLNFR
ncbi:sulfatase [Pontiella sp.]|uniref:sulfatase n=1 Tax=Pontiella sp. TaxID=2837462 RepID=UPI003564C5F0